MRDEVWFLAGGVLGMAEEVGLGPRAPTPERTVSGDFREVPRPKRRALRRRS